MIDPSTEFGNVAMRISLGHRFPDTTFVVEPLRVEEFLTALGTNRTAAEQASRPGQPIPLGFLMYVTTIGADHVHEALEVDFRRALYGGASYEIHAPAHVGDTLTVVSTFTNQTTKSTKAGQLTFFELTCDYLLEDGTLSVRERSTTIERPE